MSEPHLAELMVDHGLLERATARELLQRAAREAGAFTARVAEHFDMEIDEVYEALADEIAARAPRVSLGTERLDAGAARLLPARAAWGPLLLPMRFEQGELICATSEDTLARAVAAAEAELNDPCRFVLASPDALMQFIAERYELEGIEISE